MNKEELGEIAMELIADHPLYASTSGITHDEAIAVAMVLFGNDLKAVKEENERISSMSMEELEAELRKEGKL